VKNFNKLLVALGIQNIWQIGLFFPLHIISTLIFLLKVKIKITNNLDRFIVVYFFVGIISLMILFIKLIITQDDASNIIFINSIKSFVVFSFFLVYFGVQDIDIKDFFSAVNFTITTIITFIFLHYLYLFFFSDWNFYQMRGQITWAKGWPQRYSIFCLIGFYIFWFKFQISNRVMYLFISLIFFSSIFLSGTRSVIFALLISQLITLFISKKNFKNVVFLYISVLTFIYFSNLDIVGNFRISEIINYNTEITGSSLSNRLNSLYPEVIQSMSKLELIFGKGHVGVAFIADQDFSRDYKSLESQYLDTLFRVGLLGLLVNIIILLIGIYYTYKILKTNLNSDLDYIFQGSVAWQIAVLFHGITVETTRFSLYSLFYFLFLGIISEFYNRCGLKKNNSHK